MFLFTEHSEKHYKHKKHKRHYDRDEDTESDMSWSVYKKKKKDKQHCDKQGCSKQERLDSGSISEAECRLKSISASENETDNGYERCKKPTSKTKIEGKDDMDRYYYSHRHQSDDKYSAESTSRGKRQKREKDIEIDEEKEDDKDFSFDFTQYRSDLNKIFFRDDEFVKRYFNEIIKSQVIKCPSMHVAISLHQYFPLLHDYMNNQDRLIKSQPNLPSGIMSMTSHKCM